jgi:hypothetical protein
MSGTRTKESATFTLHYHEQSPRVTLLQILLKDEYGLRVDGVFTAYPRGASPRSWSHQFQHLPVRNMSYVR